MNSSHVHDSRESVEEGAEMVSESAADVGEKSTSSGKGRGKKMVVAAKGYRGGKSGRGGRESMEASEQRTGTPSKAPAAVAFGESAVNEGGVRRSRRLISSTVATSRSEGGRSDLELVQEGDGDSEGEGDDGGDDGGDSDDKGVGRTANEEGGAAGSVAGDTVNDAGAEDRDAESDSEEGDETDGEAMSDEESESELPESIPAAEELMKREYRRDSFACVNLMRRTPIEKFSKLKIPLCRMVSMPAVRVTLEREIERLMREFQFGYRQGSACFYVGLTNVDGSRRSVSPEITETWNEEWKAENKKFESFLNQDSDLKQVSGLMFFVWDGNHRLEAWKRVIAAQDENYDRWYGESGNPDCVVLDIPPHGVSQIQTAMHDINS